jgi:hypothetical protein
MKSIEEINRRRILFLMLIISSAFISTAFLVEKPLKVLKGEWKIITSPGILVTDFIALSNLGSAFFNAGITTLMGCVLALIIKQRINGYFISAIFALAGFSFFGKTPFNSIPIFIGVYLYDKYFLHHQVRNLIAPLLFGATLGPIVSQISFGFGWGIKGIVLGIVIGIICGGLFAAIMGHVSTFHQGYNLYNAGTSAGLIGTVVYMFMKGFGLKIDSVFYWSTEYTQFLSVYLSVLFLFLLLLGLVWGANISNFKKILNSSGHSPADYIKLTELGTTLCNMSIIGFIQLGYVLLVGGAVNGPTIAAILITTGFGALGQHPRNILPIMIGVYLVCIPQIWSHSDPGPLLAALFCTCLAPLSGRFGFFTGLVAGALHLPMVMHVGGLHGFMNLYNNGFAGGLVMLLLVGIIKGLNPKLLEGEWERKRILGFIKKEC